MNCLRICLQKMTWCKKRWYYHDIPHARKEQIELQWRRIWYKIIYKTWKRPVNKEYIEIYNTWRWTTHAVVQKDDIIIYNPYKVWDLRNKNWFICVEKV